MIVYSLFKKRLLKKNANFLPTFVIC